MKRIHHSLLLFGLLLTLLAGCKKDEDPEPSKTDLLTAHAWKDSNQQLRLNTNEGTRTPTAADQTAYQFTRDGKVTIGPASGGGTGSSTTGTWSFAFGETQLVLTVNGTATTFSLFELTSNSFSYGYSYTQAQVQEALGGGGGNNGQVLVLLLLSAGTFTFPANTPTIPAAQLTSVQWKFNTVPR